MGPSGAGVWTSPIIDTQRRALYFGTGNSFSEPAATSDSIMAMDLDTGKILWWQQAMKDDIWHGGCQQTIPNRPVNPTFASRGGRGNQPRYPRKLCGAHRPRLGLCGFPESGDHARWAHCIIASPKQAVVRALDPDKKGAIVWEQDIARGIGGGAGKTVLGGAIDRQTIYFGLQLGNGLVGMDLASGVEKWFAPLETAEGMGTQRRCCGRQSNSRSALRGRHGRHVARGFAKRRQAYLGIQDGAGV